MSSDRKPDPSLRLGMWLIGIMVGIHLLLRIGIMLGWWAPFPGA